MNGFGCEYIINRVQIHQAIRLLAGYNQRRSGSARSSSRKNDGIGPFFEQHGLAIITLLADNLVERGGLQSLSERKRCIGAIREMIRLAKSHVGNALPQVSHLPSIVLRA